MDQMAASFVSFLAILNPFALCLYLAGVIEDLDRKDLHSVLLRASLTSFFVLALFAASGEPLLTRVLNVRPEALRIFGGVIFFVLAYGYVTRGYRSMVMMRGDLDELPSEIALPFMIGAGTITQSIFLGERLGAWIGILLVFAGVALCFLVLVWFARVSERMRGPRERVFKRYVNILARLNGLIIGAVSTEMVVGGIHDLWSIR